MDFDLNPEQLAFAEEVEQFLDEYDDPSVFDLSRENLQLVDTPERRAFLGSLAARGWLGLTWPKDWGGREADEISEWILNEALAYRGAPQTGKGVGIIGKTILAHGSEYLKAKFLPKVMAGEIEFAIGYSEPDAGSDVGSLRLRAEREGDGWLLNGQKTWTTSAHFADWYWVAARTDPDDKHGGITLFLVPMDAPGITVRGIWTMGGERTNDVFLDNVFVPDDHVVGDVGRGFQYMSEALDLERFNLFMFSPLRQRLDLLTEFVGTATRDDVPLRHDPMVCRRLAQLHTEAEVARLLAVRFVAAATAGGTPPTVEASEYKLYATGVSQRLADATMDLAAPGSQLRMGTSDAPLDGRAESTYRFTVLETIGAGTSEIQKNIIARRKLGLPKNF